MKHVFTGILALLLILSGCTSTTKSDHSSTDRDQGNGSQLLPSDRELTTEFPEITSFDSSTIHFHLLGGTHRAVDIEVHKFFPTFKDTLQESFLVQPGDDIGQIERVSSSSGTVVSLDFRTGYFISEINTRTIYIQEQYLEALDEPTVELTVDDNGKPIRFLNTHIKKYRRVAHRQLYAVVHHKETDEVFLLIEPLYTTGRK